MTSENTIPLITKTAFNCPHCGAYTTQHWYQLVADAYGEKHRTPSIPTLEMIEEFKADREIPKETRDNLVSFCEKMLREKPFFENNNNSLYSRPIVQNCNISECYNCKEISVWVHDHIVYPNTKIDIPANNDLPEHIKQLFEEAREIVSCSPKGAAALLRLCVQYLCKELGESGKNIDKDIAALVAKGLNPLIQKALDVVRVIGNESVHPGEINLNDNKEIAVKLFGLVNIICEQMISQPKQINELYSDLPKAKLEGIEKRDAKSKPDE
ncbi:DUF4145 domain-containing protein [Pseudomonas benzenivorans]|nr:DUF4145 domain-containing protein [Pseudomonas benzenivorans]